MAKQNPKDQKTKSKQSNLSGNVRSEETEINAELEAIKRVRKENAELIKQKKEQIQLAKEEGENTAILEKRLKKLQDAQSKLAEKAKSFGKRQSEVTKNIDDSNKSIRRSLDSFEEIDKVLVRINSTIKQFKFSKYLLKKTKL